jgi:hypothetical protein
LWLKRKRSLSKRLKQRAVSYGNSTTLNLTHYRLVQQEEEATEVSVVAFLNPTLTLEQVTKVA